ncbi:37 kDa salivary gland allergen Aed a 2-like [Sabethes cyaneus]|uniref:37 kDa salivary gland allergen Aed a 2-like n=1 Tax=Sabethes cyaneus TaxID=53552 RepID=UPI00237D525D|nr:37 kDa salivary gland allergen Aed a 2-like [Sabethes cyaneus]
MAKNNFVVVTLLKIITLCLMTISCILADSNPPSGIDGCERNLPEKFRARLCEMRQYIIIEEAGEEDHLNCIFNELGYLTEQGDVKIDRIRRDFEITHNLNDEVQASIEECHSALQKVAPNEKKPFAFFECMLYSDNFEQLRDVIDFREIYGNDGPENGYDPKVVAKAVKAIDDKLCPRSQCSDEDEEDIDESVSFSPDDALFISTRCFDLHLSKNIAARQHFGRPNEGVECFTKCVLENFLIYSRHSLHYKSNAISAQFSDYGDYLDLQEEQVKSLIDDLNGKTIRKDSCEEIYTSFIEIFERHNETMRKLFHHPSYANSIYNRALPHIKLPNETYPAFCERNYHEVLAGKLCEIRKFSHGLEHKSNLKDPISCIFKGFRYLTPSNDINAREVRRDFKLIGRLDQQSRKDIHLCTRKAQQVCTDERAYFLYGCLLNSTSSSAFKEAFENKEILSGDYTMIIQGLPYNKQHVREKIDQIDSQICPEETEQ